MERWWFWGPDFIFGGWVLGWDREDRFLLVYDQIVEEALGDVVDAIGVAPVADVAIGAEGIDDDGLFGDAEGQGQEDVKMVGNAKLGGEGDAGYGAEYAAAQAFFNGAKHDALCGDAVVAAEVLSDALVAQDEDVGGGALARLGAGPVFQVASPTQVGEDNSVALRVSGEEVFEGLLVGPGGGVAGQVDQLAQGGEVDGLVFVEAAVAAVFMDQFSDVHGVPFCI